MNAAFGIFAVIATAISAYALGWSDRGEHEKEQELLARLDHINKMWNVWNVWNEQRTKAREAQ